MKNYIFLISILLTCFMGNDSYAQSIDAAGDALVDGDLRVGGGTITFINDINAGSPKVVSINNGNGEFKVSTLGTPGGVLTLLRDGGLQLENRNNTEIIEFEVENDGTFNLKKDAGGTTRMTIDPNGNFGFGTGTTDASGKVLIKQGTGQKALLLENTSLLDYWTVEIDGSADYTWRYQGTTPGAFIDLSDGANYKTFSDARLKSNIEEVQSILPNVLKLRATNYNFKGLESEKKTIGFLAQEVEKLFPDMVTEKEGYKTLSYASFSVLAIKAIQEQQQIIEELTERISALENK